MNIWNKISKKGLPADRHGPILKYFGYFLWIFAFAIRAYLITLPAQPYDIGTYHAWGNLMRELGPHDFFASTWSDYLPLPIYIFSFISWLSSTLHISFAILFKSFFSILELGLLAWFFRRHLSFKNQVLSTKYYALLLLSPALFLNTSWWGQTDSFPALLSIISLLYFIKAIKKPSTKYYLLSTILISLAVAFKPIIVLTLPIFFILYQTSLKQITLLQVIKASLLSFFLFLIPALFVSNNPYDAFQFLLDKTLEQASQYPYTTINAFNFWNIRSSLTTWPPDNQFLLGLSFHSWGTLIFSILSINILRLWYRAKWAKTHAPRVIATILAIFFTFTTRMHERHLLFALPFLALAITNSPWLILPYSLFTILYSFNLWSAFSWVIHDQTWPMHPIWGNLTSTLTTLTTLGLATIWSWPQTLHKFTRWIISHKSLVIILLFATLIRLVNLSHPSTHIFDEVYHAFTAQELVVNNLDAWIWWATPPEGFAYEWTHPPVAKYGMVAGLLLMGNNALGWRVFSAIMGVISLYGIYHLTLILFKTKATANLATFLVSIEGLHLVQSRIAMNDIYMLAFFVWSLNYALRNNWKKSAILYGLALASKWSALYGLIPLALIFLHSHRLNLHSLLLTARCLLITLSVYTLTYTPFLLSGYTWTQLTELHRQMWYYHTHLIATHAYQSTPLQWIFSLRPVWYWVDYGERVSNIYAQSHPLLLWLGLVALLLSLLRLRKFSHSLLIILYSAFTIPWIFSPRIMFFYHYLPSATFLMIILASWLSSFPKRTRIIILVLLFTAYCILTPVFYGFPVPQQYWDILFSIFPTWK